MSEIYTLSQVVKITDVPQPRLQQWLREKYIVPAERGEGSGSRHGFDFRNLCQIKFLDYLIKNGVSRKFAAFHAECLPSSESLKNDQEKPNCILAERDLKTQKTKISQHSFESSGNQTIVNLAIEHDPDTLPNEWTDIITIYWLERIVVEVTKGIEELNKRG